MGEPKTGQIGRKRESFIYGTGEGLEGGRGGGIEYRVTVQIP